MNLHTNLDLTPKAGEKPAKTGQKVAEITINLKTVKKSGYC